MIKFIRKYLHLFVLGIICIILVRSCYKFISRIETPDLEYNTVYSDDFDNEKFHKIKLGMSANQVIKLIGRPLKIDTTPYYHTILYANDNVSIDCGDKGVNTVNASPNTKFALIEFSKDNCIIDVFNHNMMIKKSDDELYGLSYENTIKDFGYPIQEMKYDSGYNIWYYSALKSGGHSGKSPKIFIYRIAFKEYVVSKIIYTEGNPYDAYIGLCNE